MAHTFPAVGAAARARYGAQWPGRLLDSYLDASADADPARLAVVDGPTRLTYGELRARVEGLTAGLRALGVTRGDVVSVQLPNWWEALAVHLAVIRLGAVSNPLMPILRERELRFVLASAATRVLVVPAEFRGFDHGRLAVELVGELESLEHVVTVRGRRDGALALEELIGEDPTDDDRAAAPGREPGDPVCLLYTSGTGRTPRALSTPTTRSPTRTPA